MNVDYIDSIPMKTQFKQSSSSLGSQIKSSVCEQLHVLEPPKSLPSPHNPSKFIQKADIFQQLESLEKKESEAGVNTYTVKRFWQFSYCLGLVKLLLTVILALYKGTEKVRCILKQKQCQGSFQINLWSTAYAYNSFAELFLRIVEIKCQLYKLCKNIVCAYTAEDSDK